MTDYISREDALNFEIEIEADPEEIQAITKGMALYGEYIKSIPAVEVVERKNGKWKAASEDLIICTSCKCGFLLPYPNRIEEAKTVYGWNFCPNCGADMRGDSNE